MPKMSRTQFSASIDDMWLLTQRTVVNAGMVFSTLIALDAMGRQQILIQVPQEDPRIDARGAISIVGTWDAHHDTVQAAFRRHNAVAAIFYGEGWSVANDIYLETVRMDIAASEHPMKDEIIFAYGFWPREHLTHGHRATIVRDDHGNIATLRTTDDTDTTAGATIVGSWVQDLLPRPY